MPLQIDYEVLEELSKGEGLNQIQNVFVSLISELIDYLKLIRNWIKEIWQNTAQ